MTTVGFDLIGFVIELVVSGVILGIFVWLAGKALGAPKATYYHGILIVVSAIILRDIIAHFMSGWGWVARIIELVVVLLLIKHFFSVGWIKAIIIAILAVIIGIIIMTVLAMVGLAFAASMIKGLIPEI